jgi:hypothetical protein
MSSWFYQWPTGLSFVVFSAIIVAASVIGLYLFKLTNLTCNICGEHNTIVGIFAATVSVFLGIILSFIIVTVWGNYSTAQLNALKEAEILYLLYGTVRTLPNTQATQQLIISYLKFIINVEYPAMHNGQIPPEQDNFFDILRIAIYGYNPQTDQQTVLYTESIDLLNQAIILRIDRLNSAFRGVYMVIWWVSIIDSILIVFISWFINCPGMVHYIMMFIIGLYVATALYLVLILSYPFEGYLGLDADPFEATLAQILRFPGNTQNNDVQETQ